jgi:Flp pilus assembly protein TadD
VHLQVLENSSWLSAAEMNSPHEPGAVFYAQSWALVHMLRREPAFPDRVTARMLTELRQHLRSVRPTPVKVPVTATAASTAQSVSALDALLLQADLALRTSHGDLAHKLYAQAARDFPKSSSAATGLATLALGDGDREKASSELRRALDLDAHDSRAWFELAVMNNDTPALRKVVELDPNFAEAHILLGVRATDDGDLDAALQHLEQATRLMPRKSYAWYSLGYAQQKAGDTTAARQSLDRALLFATAPEQRSMAATLLDSMP